MEGEGHTQVKCILSDNWIMESRGWWYRSMQTSTSNLFICLMGIDHFRDANVGFHDRAGVIVWISTARYNLQRHQRSVPLILGLYGAGG